MLVYKGGFVVVPISIYVNFRCHRSALCLKHLFPLLESLDRLLSCLWKGFDYSGKNYLITKSIQESHGSIEYRIL